MSVSGRFRIQQQVNDIKTVKNVHLGTDDLLGMEGGIITDSDANVLEWTASSANENDYMIHSIRYKTSVSKFPKETWGTYDESDGSLVLIKGIWVICASVNINKSPAKMLTGVAVRYGEKIRHKSVLDDENSDTVTATVLADGSTTTDIVIIAKSNNNSGTKTVTNTAAHAHLIWFGESEPFA